VVLDLNSGSRFVYGRPTGEPTLGERIGGLVDAALLAEREAMPPRNYLGASRIGEPCARRLCYEVMHLPPDPGKAFTGRLLRVFETGHRFEGMTIRWLRLAGFDLRTCKRDGSQFGFSAADGRFQGHIDGVIVDGPDVGFPYPVLFEHKAVNDATWSEIVKRGLRSAAPVYWSQVQVYMAYLEIERTLVVALDKDTEALTFDLIAFDPTAAQDLSDKAVAVLSAVDAGELLPRIAAREDFYLCRMCPFAGRCWHAEQPPKSVPSLPSWRRAA